jgi:two-component system sensor histidine kinase/response regulator
VMCAQAIMRAHLRAAEKAANQASKLAQRVAELANKSKADFVATISHDLRTPMNAVIGYTQLIADELYGPVTPLQREHLERISASGKHLLGLVEQLLSHARIESREETVALSDVELTVVLEQSLMLVRPLAERKGRRVRTEGAAPPLQLHTDPGKVRQILVNLLGNALKFSDGGDIVLTTRIAGAGAGLRVSFAVSDTGMGLAPEHIDRIFEPFWRVDSALVREREGTGLGLSVARQLARLLGGDVVVGASELERGSTFVLSLPVRPRSSRSIGDAG